MPSSKLVLLSGGAAQSLVRSLAAQFETETGYAIEGAFDAVGALARRARAGAAADVLILTSALVAELARDGYVAGDSVVDVGVVETGIAVRAGDPAPAIHTAAALREALLGAGHIYFPDPQQATAGIHFAKVTRELGVWDAVAPRLRPFPNGATAMREMAADKGARPIGCTQVTEILNTPGVALVGPLPPGCELATVYAAAVASNAASPAQARRFIELLASEASSSVRRRAGFSAAR
jgi:molybdate transport system substrate-binding protein